MLLARAQSSSCLSASRHPQPSSLSSVSFCRGSSFLQGSLAQTPAAPVHSFANTQTALLQAVAYGRSLSITASLSLLKAIRVLPTIELVASFVPPFLQTASTSTGAILLLLHLPPHNTPLSVCWGPPPITGLWGQTILVPWNPW